MKSLSSNHLKKVLLTGASRGIGKAILHKLIRQGYLVFGTATTEKSARAITEFISKSGGKGFGLVLNLGVDDIDNFVMNLCKDFGSPDIFINNAGITRDNLLIRMSNEDWDTVIEINLSSTFKLSRAILKPMIRARWGRIVFISSVVGLSGNAGQANYASAKAALGGFCRSIAKEIASRGITVNCVAPGYIETDMTNNLKSGFKCDLALITS